MTSHHDHDHRDGGRSLPGRDAGRSRRGEFPRELGDRLRDFLANLEDESASDLRELARLSRSATDQATLLELARTSPPPDAWFGDD